MRRENTFSSDNLAVPTWPSQQMPRRNDTPLTSQTFYLRRQAGIQGSEYRSSCQSISGNHKQYPSHPFHTIQDQFGT